VARENPAPNEIPGKETSRRDPELTGYMRKKSIPWTGSIIGGNQRDEVPIDVEPGKRDIHRSPSRPEKKPLGQRKGERRHKG